MAPKLKIRLIRWAAKTCVWSLVVSILMASLPIPIAVVSHSGSDARDPFPCQHGNCGCKSAFQCWTGCCCNSPQERLEWAARNGVAVPEYGQHLIKLVAEQKASQSTAKPACCETSKPSSCCEVKNSCCKPAPRAKASEGNAKAKTKIVLSMLALGCRGSLGELASLPWAVVDAPTLSIVRLNPLVGELQVVDIHGPTHFYPPDLPPPRLS